MAHPDAGTTPPSSILLPPAAQGAVCRRQLRRDLGLLEAELFGIEDRTATGVRGRRGKFEHAHEGTLFLDEVSDLSSAAQAKLPRAIQDLSVELRPKDE